MPNIYIGNVDNEHMIRDADKASPTDVRMSAEAARRLLWFASDGDVYVLPIRPTPDFLRHVAEITGVDPATVQIYAAPDSGAPGVLLWDTIWQPRLLTALSRAVVDPREWGVFAYYTDRIVARLAERLGISLQNHDFLREGGAELLNSKAVFRRLAAGTGAPLARGGVVSSAAMLLDLVGELLDDSDAVIVKQDLNSAAHGNVVLTRRPDTDHAGASRRVVVSGRAALAEVVPALWSRMVPGGYGELVVEHYHPGSDSLYVELCVTDGDPVVWGWGRERMEPVWVGFEISESVLHPESRDELLDVARALGRTARDLGYRGLMSVDAIRTPEGTLVLNEQNGRVSGCTHIHHLLRRYADWPQRDLTVLTRNWVPSGPLAEVRRRLSDAGLAWQPSERSGVLVLADDPEPPGNVELMVVGTSEQEARTVERLALAEIAASRRLADEHRATPALD